MVIFALPAGTACLHADQPPSLAEQQAYQAAEQAVVEAVNAYRAAQTPALPPLVALMELCGGARLEAEARLTDPSSQIAANEALNLGYTGIFTGFIDGFFYPSGDALVSALIADANPTYRNDMINPVAKYIGVGVAVRASGETSSIQWAVCLGGDGVGTAPYGTPGIETNSSRGLPDLTKIDALLTGAISGDSITGFLYDPNAALLTPAVLAKFGKALKKLLKAPPVVTVSVGQPVAFRLPADVFKLVENVKIKGKLPPGVRFDKKRGRFRGAPKIPGHYTLRLIAKLKAAINGSRNLAPIKVRFHVGG